MAGSRPPPHCRRTAAVADTVCTHVPLATLAVQIGLLMLEGARSGEARHGAPKSPPPSLAQVHLGTAL